MRSSELCVHFIILYMMCTSSVRFVITGQLVNGVPINRSLIISECIDGLSFGKLFLRNRVIQELKTSEIDRGSRLCQLRFTTTSTQRFATKRLDPIGSNKTEDNDNNIRLLCMSRDGKSLKIRRVDSTRPRKCSWQVTQANKRKHRYCKFRSVRWNKYLCISDSAIMSSCDWLNKTNKLLLGNDSKLLI